MACCLSSNVYDVLLSLQEREYIKQEARTVFGQHKNLGSPADIEAKVGGSSSSRHSGSSDRSCSSGSKNPGLHRRQAPLNHCAIASSITSSQLGALCSGGCRDFESL
jgi:hypothetical protein